MKSNRILRSLVVIALLAGAAIAAYATSDRWMPVLTHKQTTVSSDEAAAPPATPSKIIVNELAQRNLGIRAAPLKLQTYWRTIRVPGMVVDRPGQSDRNIVAKAAGVISEVDVLPGDTVQPGQVLFVIRFLSPTLHDAQADLLKATQDLALAEAHKARLATVINVVPAEEVIEADNEVKRQTAAIIAYKQALRNYGFNDELITAVSQGQFVTEMPITVPDIPRPVDHDADLPSDSLGATLASRTFELEKLNVDLGQMVDAGQSLCLLADHEQVIVEGRAFRDETALLERSVRENWPVEVDFSEEGDDWGPLGQTFYIRHLANVIDPETRTFAFQMPLTNQSRIVDIEGRSQMLWRFRPGQKLRLMVRIEEMANVFVVPADGVASDGTESFIFLQNVNTFERKPVRVLLRDRQQVVVANDGTLVPGTFAVQLAAEQLNRMIRAGQNTGAPKGYHIHADGSLHKNSDEGK